MLCHDLSIFSSPLPPSCILPPLLQQLNFLCLHQRRTEDGWNTPLVNKTFNQKFSCIKTIRRVSQHRLLRVLQHRRKLSPIGRGAVGAGAPPPPQGYNTKQFCPAVCGLKMLLRTTACERSVSGDLPLHALLRSIVFLQRPLTAPLHPMFGPLRPVFRSAHAPLTLRSHALLRTHCA